MLSKWQFHLLNALAVLAIALVAANGVLFKQNRSEQSALNQRQQFIQQTAQLETLQRELINAIANLAARNNDDALRGILTEYGIAPGAAPRPPGRP